MVVQRVLIRHGVSRDLIGLLLEDLQRGIDYLRANPVRHSSAGPTFSHGATTDAPEDANSLDRMPLRVAESVPLAQPVH